MFCIIILCSWHEQILTNLLNMQNLKKMLDDEDAIEAEYYVGLIICLVAVVTHHMLYRDFHQALPP